MVARARSVAGAAELVHGCEWSLAIVDHQLAGRRRATKCSTRCARANPALPVVMLTGEGAEETAIEAFRHGASDYVVKGGPTWRRSRPRPRPGRRDVPSQDGLMNDPAAWSRTTTPRSPPRSPPTSPRTASRSSAPPPTGAARSRSPRRRSPSSRSSTSACRASRASSCRARSARPPRHAHLRLHRRRRRAARGRGRSPPAPRPRAQGGAARRPRPRARGRCRGRLVRRPAPREAGRACTGS